MNQFTLFWRDGKKEVIEGNAIDDAFTRRGYGAGALRALDFYWEGSVLDRYLWDEKLSQWQINPDASKPEQVTTDVPPGVFTVKLSDHAKIEITFMEHGGDINLDMRRFISKDPESNTWLPTSKGIRVPKDFIDDLISSLQDLKATMP